jgi:hypothetical protein
MDAKPLRVGQATGRARMVEVQAGGFLGGLINDRPAVFP